MSSRPSSPAPPTVTAKRSRRNGLYNPPAPDVPPSPPLPPLPPKSPLRTRQRSRSSIDSLSLSALSSPFPTPTIEMPQTSSAFAAQQTLGAPTLDIGISSSPFSISSSTFGSHASHSTTTIASSYAPPTPSTSTSNTTTSVTISKKTHALRELLNTERAYATDMALVRDVYIHLARDPVAPFTDAVPPPQAQPHTAPLPAVQVHIQPSLPPTTTKGPRNRSSTNPKRPRTASSIPTPPISPSPSPATSTSFLRSPTALLPSLSKKTSAPLLSNFDSNSNTLNRSTSTTSGGTSAHRRHKQPLSELDIQIIFGNVDKLAGLAEVLSDRLEAAVAGEGEDEGAGLGQLMLEFLPHMIPHYKVYVSKHAAALDHLKALTPSIAPYLTTARQLTMPHTNAWDLPSLIIKPVQRVMKYPLLLQAVIDATPGEARGGVQLREAKRLAEQACVDINESKRLWEEVGKVVRGAKGRKFAITPGANMYKGGLGPELEGWDVRLEEAERTARKVVKDALEWSKAVRGTLVSLVEWGDAAERVMLVGVREGDEDDGRGRWARAVVELILDRCWKPLDGRLHVRLLPAVAQLISSLSSPRVLIAALRASLPSSLADPVRTQLRAELPRLMLLFERALARCVVNIAAWQATFWDSVRKEWGRALGEDELPEGAGKQQQQQPIESAPPPQTITLDSPPPDPHPLHAANNSLGSAADQEHEALFYSLPIARSSSSLLSPEDMDMTAIAFHPDSSDGSAPTPPSGSRPPRARPVLAPPLEIGSRQQYSQSRAVSGSTLSSSNGYEPSRARGLYTLNGDGEGSGSSSSVHIPEMPSPTSFFTAVNDLTTSEPSSTPSLSRDSYPSSREKFHLDIAALDAAAAPSPMPPNEWSQQTGLKGMPLDEALRSMGVDDPEWEDVYRLKRSHSSDSIPSPPASNSVSRPSSPTAGSRPSSRAARGIRRLKSSASTKSMSKLFRSQTSRSPPPDGESKRSVTERGKRRDDPPPPLPPTPSGMSSWTTVHPSLVTPPAEPTISRQPSFREKVTAYRHSRVSSSTSSETGPSHSLRSSSNSGASSTYAPSSYSNPNPVPIPFTPPSLKSTSFLVSPITAFHLPSPRNQQLYTFHGLPFLTLHVGEIIRIIQDGGRPNDYKNFPLWTDGQEDRLLVGRNEDGAEGWLLASFVVPLG